MLTRFICPACGLKFEAFLPKFTAGVSRNLPHCPNSACKVPVDEEDIDTSKPLYARAWYGAGAGLRRTGDGLFFLVCLVLSGMAFGAAYTLFGLGHACHGTAWLLRLTAKGIIFLEFVLVHVVHYATAPMWFPIWLAWDRLGRPFRGKPWLMSTKEFERIKAEVRKKQNVEMNVKANNEYYQKNKNLIEASKQIPRPAVKVIEPLTDAERAEVAARMTRDFDADRVQSLRITGHQPQGYFSWECAECGTQFQSAAGAHACCDPSNGSYWHACQQCRGKYNTKKEADECCVMWHKCVSCGVEWKTPEQAAKCRSKHYSNEDLNF